jgi:hypothetical protein
MRNTIFVVGVLALIGISMGFVGTIAAEAG